MRLNGAKSATRFWGGEEYNIKVEALSRLSELIHDDRLWNRTPEAQRKGLKKSERDQHSLFNFSSYARNNRL